MRTGVADGAGGASVFEAMAAPATPRPTTIGATIIAMRANGELDVCAGDEGDGDFTGRREGAKFWGGSERRAVRSSVFGAVRSSPRIRASQRFAISSADGGRFDGSGSSIDRTKLWMPGT